LFKKKQVFPALPHIQQQLWRACCIARSQLRNGIFLHASIHARRCS